MGLFNWVKRQPSRGAGYAKKVIAAEEIQKGGQFIADMASSMGVKEGRQETFENAYARKGLTEEDIRASYQFFMGRFHMFIFFFGLGVAVMIYFFWFNGLWGGIPVLGFLAVCAAQLFNASFRMYQIRRRELAPVIVWLRQPKEWWVQPLPDRPTGRNDKSLTRKK